MITISRHGFPWRALLVPAFSVLLGIGAGLASTPPAESETPLEVRKGIEQALIEKARDLGKEKDEQGKPYKRCNYSHSFRRVDDSTYKVGFHIDTATPENLVTERYVLTLKASGGKWSITGEELQDTYKGLFRLLRDDEECFRFERFSFSREGLEATATNGSMCKDYLVDEVVRFSVASDDLAYEYVPPIPQDQVLFELIKKEKAKEALFKPEFAHVECDPASCEELISTSFTGLQPASYDQSHEGLRSNWEEFRKESDEALAKDPFAGFWRPYEPDRSFYSIRLKRKGVGEQWLGLTFDSFEGNEVSFVMQGLEATLLGFDFSTPLFTYHSEKTRNSGLSPDELERRPDSITRSYDLQRVKGSLEMGFGDGQTLIGDLTYGLTTKRALREIPFYIARLSNIGQPQSDRTPRMDINSLQDGDGNEMTWVRVGPLEGLVVLPEEVPAGTYMTMRLQFENKDLLYKMTPAFTNVDRGGWLPFNQFADFIHEFDLTIKVPARYKTLGIGQKVSEETKDGASITRWVANQPISFPAVIFGLYNEATSSIKAKKLDGTEIPVVMHVDKDSMAAWSLRPKALEKLADDAVNSLNLYTQIFQVDYPYDKLDLVNDPAGIFYAQAPSSLIYVGSPVFIASGTLATGGQYGDGGGADIAFFTDSVIPHEVAHQWWGSLITMANFRNYWFVESLAEYSSALFMEYRYGKEKYAKHVDAWRREILENDMRSAVQNGYTEWQGPGGFGPFRAALYSKGPYAFHIMRSTWGDEAFFKFLKTLVNDLKGKEIVTRDIQRVAEKSFGANLDWFFDQWLRGVGLPEYTFTYAVRETEEGNFLIEGEVSQRILLKAAMDNNKEVLDGQYFTGLVPITVIGKSGKEYRKKLILEGPKTTFQFTIPEKPKDVIFNKYGESLSYDTVVSASR